MPGALGTLGPNGQPELQSLVFAGSLADLRWPNFPDYHGQAAAFYGPSGYALAWTDAGHPTPQAIAMIQVFKNANLKGLNPELHYATLPDGTRALRSWRPLRPIRPRPTWFISTLR